MNVDDRRISASGRLQRDEERNFMHSLPASRSMSVLVSALLAAALSGPLYADPIPVRYAQGSAHGFLVLKTIEGVSIATGDATQIIHGTASPPA
jgi:hypothetical protein